MHIHVLDQHIINRIAAGEVVERPASVIKELVENAIDAGATTIDIEILDGGISFMQVTDNGIGIPADEVKTAFLPHATSKIQTAEDLIGIDTLGFRGEALASIASVAEVTVLTKTRDASFAWEQKIHFGELVAEGEAAGIDGTRMTVSNLFAHVPARKKFLRTPQTEAGHIEELLIRLFLSNPSIAFRYTNQGIMKMQTSGSGNLETVISELYGKEIASNLIPISFSKNNFSISGFLGRPAIARGNRRYENYFINGRYFRDGTIAKAIEDAYHPYLMQHKFPFVVLAFAIDSDEIDVNVHPGKLEIRFRNRNQVFQAVTEGISITLQEMNSIPQVSLEDEKRGQAQIKPVVPQEQTKSEQIIYRPNDVPQDPKEAKNFFLDEMRKRVTKRFEEQAQKQTEKSPVVSESKKPITLSVPQKKEKEPEQISFFEGSHQLTKQNRRNYRLIGQLFSTYWLFEYEEQFLMLDQHAAHEKVYFERFIKMLDEMEIPSQQIYPAVVLKLSLSEQNLLKEHMDLFTKFGFEIDHFEGHDFAIRAVPALLSNLREKDLFLEMLDDLDDSIRNDRLSMTIEHRLATMACKAAVKGNHRMTIREAEALLDELMTLDHPYQCPHGRPTMVFMTKAEIEKKFMRIV